MTSEIKAMYTALQQKPRDCNARLALADALEEDGQQVNAASHRIIAYPNLMLYREQLADLYLSRGEAKRAQFIRDCISLAQIGNPDLLFSVYSVMRGNSGDLKTLRLIQSYRNAYMKYGAVWRAGPQCPTCSKPPGPNKNCLFCAGAVDGGGLMTLCSRTSIDNVYLYLVSYIETGNPGCKTITVPTLRDLYVHTEVPTRKKEPLHHYVPSELLLRFCRHPDAIEIQVENAAPYWSGAGYTWYDMNRPMKSGATPAASEIPGPLMRWLVPTDSPLDGRMAIYSEIYEAEKDLSRAIVRWATSMW